MKTSKGQIFLFLFLLLVTTVAGGLAWKYYNRSIKFAAQLLNPDERASQAKRIADYQAQIKKLQDRLAATRGRGNDQTDVADNGGGGRRPGRGGNFGAFQTVMNSPEFQKLQALQIKGSLDARYAALFKSLNLTPDQVAQIKDLLVNKQQAVTDAFAAARDQGINPRTDPQDFQAAVQAAQTSVNDQIKSVLGDAGYAQYQQYEQTTPQRNVVSQLQQSLSYGSTPLTDDQASQMVQILAQTTPQQGGQGGGGFRNAFGGGGAPATITDQALTQAQGILSQPQIQALQQIQQQQQAQRQMQQLMRSAIQNANGGAAQNGGG